MPRKPKPITIQGVKYDSHKQAAEAFSVSYRTVISAKARGRLDTLGIGTGKNFNRKSKGYERLKKHLKRGIASKPILIQGVEYPSRKIAAEVLGVSVATIIRADKNNYLDKLGSELRGRPRKG